MSYIFRKITPLILAVLERGKSVLLLGPRQTGKTTLLRHIPSDLTISLIEPRHRLRYEKDPQLLADEIGALGVEFPLVIIDEIQKVPDLMDVVQWVIDQGKAQFILTASSARKLKHHSRDINLLPGRVVAFMMPPMGLSEFPQSPPLDSLLSYGSLPGIYSLTEEEKNEDLGTYVVTYLEEEVRAEALVRNLGSFARFLELAASESGNIINFAKLSKEIGVSQYTIQSYFQILEDCLIIKRIEPITTGKTRKKLTRSPRYLFFDLGVRRLASKEDAHPPLMAKGQWFEQWVGLELLKLVPFYKDRPFHLHFWRDPSGPEVDWVLQVGQQYIPIEVKWTDAPDKKDAKHLITFMSEYPCTKGYVICRTPRPVKLSESVIALPWQDIATVFESR